MLETDLCAGRRGARVYGHALDRAISAVAWPTPVVPISC